MPESAMTERDIFITALQKDDPAERQAYLAEVCAGQPKLREQVEGLLRLYQQAGSFLEQPAAAPPGGATGAFAAGGAEHPSSAEHEEVGAVIAGRYKLAEQIGEGGMGTVWMAQQTEPVKRVVALKVIKPGMDSKQVLARFEAERQALALMEHPNIARVLDAGTTAGGRPFFVMELVKGVPLTKYCNEHRLTPRQRLELFIPVCQAIQHAHQKGIIHRDIKPSNVLVALYDGKPVPKVIDFGIAKATGQQLTEHTLLTGFGAVVGTLEYMSPEQAELNQLDIDTRSDIYSLGVLLYELLTGTTPLDRKRLKEAALLEVLRVIREEEPPRPSTRLSTTEELPSVAANRGLEPRKLSGVVRGELDWIVMKALEKDRNRRYETANGFAMDVQRYLADEPVLACPPSAWYRFRKFARRNKAKLAVAGLILLFIVVLGGGGGWVIRDRAAREQRLAAQIERILDDVDRLEREQKWPEALAVAERAETALEGGEADDAVRRRVRDVRRDLAFVARLDRIRQEHGATVEGTFNEAAVARDYALAFREYGLDVEALAAAEAVARLREKPALAAPIAAALDDWVGARRELGDRAASWKTLVALARGLDPNPLRDRLRATWGRPVTPELQAELLRLTEGVDIKAQGPATLDALAVTLRQADLPDAAVQVLRDGQHAYPGDFWLNYDLGIVLRQREQFAEGLRYSSAALSLRPDCGVVHFNLGVALSGQKKLDEAITEYRLAIALDPKLAIAHNNLGNALDAQKKLDEAIAEYRQAIALDPKCAKAYANLGRALSEQGKLDEAVAQCRLAIALDPKLANPHINLGDALREQKKVDEAIAEYRQAIALDPKLAGAHINLGNVLHAQKKLDEAIAEYRQAIALDPKAAGAHGNLGAALAQQEKLDDAIAECRLAIALDPKLANPHMNLGNALREQKKVDEAIAEYRQAIALDPKNAKAHYNLGLTMYDQGKLAEAVAEFRKAIALDPKVAGAHSNLGLALHDQGKLEEAVAEHRQAIALDPKSAPAHNNLGLDLHDQGKLEEAIAELRQAIALDPKYARAHSNLGVTLRDQKKLTEAVAEFRKAIALDPKDAKAHTNLGGALHDQGDVAGAFGQFRKAIALDPKNAKAHYNLGQALSEQGKLDEAVAECRQAIALDPKDAKAHNSLGMALHAQKKLTEAVAEYRQAIALDPKDAKAHYNLGGALHDQGDVAGAFAQLRQASALDPKDAKAHYNLGVALSEQGKLDEAIAEYHLAIEFDPKLANAHGGLGLALHAQKKLDEAIAEYRRAIALDPKNAVAHCNLGLALNVQGKLEEAIAEHRKAIALDPKYAIAHNNLGVALRDQGKLDEAIREFREAMRLKPDVAVVHYSLGLALARNRQLDEAIAEFREAIRLKPDYAEAHGDRDVALGRKGMLDEAIAEYREAIRIKKDYAEAHSNLGAALHDKGRPDEAIAAFREAIRIKPDYSMAHYNLGNALREKGMLDEAIAEYREAIRIKKGYVDAHCNVGLALEQQGEFRAGLEELRRGHELGSKRPGWRYPSAQWVRQCERLVALDEKLPGFIDGKSTPASAAERIELAQLCQHYRKQYAAAARFYAEAFAAESKLAEDLGAAHRYNAACVAALAGCGEGKDADKLSEKEKTQLRGRALGWLRADLLLRGKQLASGNRADVGDVQVKMRWWLGDADFAGLRGPEALAKLPEAERQPWQKLWDDVAALLKRAQGKAASEKK
jgi:tetratricopeptide (TPR) repeat protein